MAKASKVDAKDPYAGDPPAHPALLLHARRPCTAEVPRSLLLHSWVTPSDLWYIRSHHPVPKVDAASHKIQVLLGSVFHSPARDSTRDPLARACACTLYFRM